MNAPGIEARRAETAHTGSVHESPAARNARGAIGVQRFAGSGLGHAVQYSRLCQARQCEMLAVMRDSTISYFARTNHHNKAVPFGTKQADRLSHMYVIGKTGVGKSTLLQTLALQDFTAGRGFALVDPHGDLVESLAKGIARLDPERLVYLDAIDPSQPYGYNPLRRVRDDKIPLAVSGLLETLKKLWPDAWGVRMEHVLRNSLFTLLERDDSRLPDILQLYSDDEFRKTIVRDIRNDTVKRFWEDEFNNYPARLRAESCAPIQNKLGALLSDPTLYRILVEPKIDLHFRSLMDDGKVLLVNVSKGRLGEECALLLGSLVVSTLGLAAFSRAEAAPGERRPFFVYLDEFHNFTTLMLANMMSELRKYGVGLVLAHQYVHQLEPDIQHAVLGTRAQSFPFASDQKTHRSWPRSFSRNLKCTI